MLSRLITFSTRAPVFVVAAALFVVGLVVARLDTMSVDVFPELLAPRVLVQTEAGSYSADDVADFVTRPIELSCLSLPGVTNVRSTSRLGLSMVLIDFEWDTDPYLARQLVAERVDQIAGELPDDVHTELAPLTATAGEILLVALTGDDVDPLALRRSAEFDLRPALLSVQGVALVTVMGGGFAEVRVEIEPERLEQFGLVPDDVAEAARSALQVGSLGYLPSVGARELPLSFTGRVEDARDLARTPLVGDGLEGLTLGDVARVELAPMPARGEASSMGRPAVVVSIQKTPGVNTLALTDEIDRVLDRFEQRLPAGAELDRDAIRQASFIQRSIDSLTHKLLEAAAVVAAVLILLMRDKRTILVSLAALPCALAAAIGTLHLFGLSLNVMTLGGLAIALGELVDDAIIDAENVARRLGAKKVKGRAKAAIVAAGSNEVRRSIVYATGILGVVFLPVLALEGLEGRFLVPLAVAYLTAIGASLVVAVTVTPALCVLLLGSGNAADSGDDDEHSPLVLRWLEVLHAFTLRHSLRVAGLVLLLALALGVGAGVASSGFGARFLPVFREGTLTVFLSAPPGSSLEAASRLGTAVDRRLAELDGVAGVVRRTGRAERDEHAEPPSNSEIEVRLDPDADLDAVRERVEELLDSIPGVTTMIGQPIEHRLSHLVSGTPADIAVSFYGDDELALRAAGEETERALADLAGVTSALTQRELVTRQIPVDPRPEILARLQLTRGEFARQVGLAFAGREVGLVRDGLVRTPVTVRLAEERRRDMAHLAAFPIVGANGRVVRLDEVARLEVENRSNLILQEGGRRKNSVQVQLEAGADADGVARRAEVLATAIAAEHGLDVELAGQFEAQRRTRSTLAIYGLGALVGIFFLLRQGLGGSWLALLVLLNLPLALMGGVAAVQLVGGWNAVLSVSELVGFVALSGLAMRNGILLVHRIRDLENEGVPTRAAILDGTRQRLGPILMTALTAAGALIPLAIAPNQPGSELLAPMAVVVLGGLVTSTVLNLLVVPCGYALLARVGLVTREEPDDAVTNPAIASPALT